MGGLAKVLKERSSVALLVEKGFKYDEMVDHLR